MVVTRGIRWSANIGTQHGLARFSPGGTQFPVTHTGTIVLGQVSSDNPVLGVSGSGEIIYTENYAETCNVSGDTITYTWGVTSGSRSVSGVVNPAFVASSAPASMFRMPIFQVTGSCPSLPAEGDLYQYVSGECHAIVDIEWIFTIGGSGMDIPNYGITASGAGSTASQNTVSAIGVVGSTISARSARFSQINLTGGPGTYAISSIIGQAYQPRYSINAQLNHRYSEGSTIAASEFTALTAVNANVLFDASTSAVVGQIPRVDTAGRVLSLGSDQAYVMVWKGTQNTSSMNANLNGSYGSGNHWLVFTFTQSLATPGSMPISITAINFRLNPTAFNPGLDLYTGLPDLDSGYTVRISSIDSVAITGSWVTSGGGSALTFIPATDYEMCGYRWLSVVLSSTSGGTVTIDSIAHTLAAGETITVTVDRFGDDACLLTPQTSLGSPQINATITGDVTGGTVTATHLGPAGEVVGASIYFSRTASLRVADEGDPHTLGMLCLFSGGCPGLRLNDMTIADLLDFFDDNPAAGMTITLEAGSLTPTSGTREWAHYGNGLALSSINSGLPFFESIDSAGVVKKLVRGFISASFPLYAGDVIGSTSGSAQTTVVRFGRVCPIAYFYTLLDGLEDTYEVTVHDSTGAPANAVNLTGTMAADSFGFMITGDEIGKSKLIGTSTLQVNVIDSTEILKIGSVDAGAFVPA